MMNSKQQAFVCSYLESHCATKAAQAAGYSSRTAYSQGHRLLKNVEVAQAIRSAHEQAASRAEVTLDRILQELAQIALGPKRDMIKLRALELLGRRLGLESEQVGYTSNLKSAVQRLRAQLVPPRS